MATKQGMMMVSAMVLADDVSFGSCSIVMSTSGYFLSNTNEAEHPIRFANRAI